MATVQLTPEAVDQAERLPKRIHDRLLILAKPVTWPAGTGYELAIIAFAFAYPETQSSWTRSAIGESSMKTKSQRKNVQSTTREYVTRNGRRFVVVEEDEYERLRMKADEWEPLLPDPLPNGNYPAVEYLTVSLARKIIRHRRRLGLTQVELARRAGVRPETLNRAEQGKVSPSIGTVEKIDRALKEAEKDNL